MPDPARDLIALLYILSVFSNQTKWIKVTLTRDSQPRTRKQVVTSHSTLIAAASNAACSAGCLVLTAMPNCDEKSPMRLPSPGARSERTVPGRGSAAPRPVRPARCTYVSEMSGL